MSMLNYACSSYSYRYYLRKSITTSNSYIRGITYEDAIIMLYCDEASLLLLLLLL